VRFTARINKNNMKQTAVEWLQIMLIPTPYDEEDIEHNRKCWEQAKAMEKEQIERAYQQGGIDAQNNSIK
jgi:hypothetical protein